MYQRILHILFMLFEPETGETPLAHFVRFLPLKGATSIELTWWLCYKEGFTGETPPTRVARHLALKRGGRESCLQQLWDFFGKHKCLPYDFEIMTRFPVGHGLIHAAVYWLCWQSHGKHKCLPYIIWFVYGGCQSLRHATRDTSLYTREARGRNPSVSHPLNSSP